MTAQKGCGDDRESQDRRFIGFRAGIEEHKREEATENRHQRKADDPHDQAEPREFPDRIMQGAAVFLPEEGARYQAGAIVQRSGCEGHDAEDTAYHRIGDDVILAAEIEQDVVEQQDEQEGAQLVGGARAADEDDLLEIMRIELGEGRAKRCALVFEMPQQIEEHQIGAQAGR